MRHVEELLPPMELTCRARLSCAGAGLMKNMARQVAFLVKNALRRGYLDQGKSLKLPQLGRDHGSAVAWMRNQG